MGAKQIVRPSEAVLLEALRLNSAELGAVRRLDQQLVYVPLASIAAVTYAFAQHTDTLPFAIGDPRLVWLGALALALTVVAGLRRNHERHSDLLDRRDFMLELLGLDKVHKDRAFFMGRFILFALFLIGLLAETFVLAELVSEFG